MQMERAMDNQPRRYNEFYIIKQNGKVISKILTERGHVSIDARTAEIMNQNTERSNIVYELADVQPQKPVDEKEHRKELVAKAKEMGLEFAKNIKTEDLEQLIKDK